MDISTLDLVLLNIVSVCGGVLCTFLFIFTCCEKRRFESIATRSYIDDAMNHQHMVYPPVAPVVTASAPQPQEINIKI